MVGNYKVITLCGSTRFKNEFMEAQKELTLQGNIVISVGMFGHAGDSEVWENMDEGTLTRTKEMLDDMHKRKIDMSDEIFVINVGGYIGESTKSEIEYAKVHGKVVRYLEAQEYFDILDENGIKIGKTKLRTEVHRDGDWHKAVHIWIINDKGDILLQRRCATKDSYPNMLDISSAGHLSAGDDSLSGAIRELKEELNIDVKPEELQFIKTLKKSSRYTETFINNEFDDLYILKTTKTIEEMKYQEEEISEIFYVTYKEFKNMVINRQPDLLRNEDEFEILFNLFDSEFDN